MKGRKPRTENVVPMRQLDGLSFEERAIQQSNDLRPNDLTEDQMRIWDEVGPELAKRRRLNALYLHTIIEYVCALDRLYKYRQELSDNGETYVIDGRNGKQIKSVPEVAQYNETWRQWRSLTNDLGLNPQAERSLGPLVADLFGDDPADEFF